MQKWIGLGALCAIAFACGGSTTMLGSAEGTTPDSSAPPAENVRGDVSDAAPPIVVDSGKPCGEKGGVSLGTCQPGEYCAHANGACSGAGTCRVAPPVPASTDCVRPACSCAGQMYCHIEEAWALGIDAVPGACGRKCGNLTCNAPFEYCDRDFSGLAPADGGIPQQVSCKTFAAAGCAEDHTCACVQASTANGDACEADGPSIRVDRWTW